MQNNQGNHHPDKHHELNFQTVLCAEAMPQPVQRKPKPSKKRLVLVFGHVGLNRPP